jgi:hypothetical protein
MTVWPQNKAEADWPFSDIEVLDVRTEQLCLSEYFIEFNEATLDRWLAALEAVSIRQ